MTPQEIRCKIQDLGFQPSVVSPMVVEPVAGRHDKPADLPPAFCGRIERAQRSGSCVLLEFTAPG